MHKLVGTIVEWNGGSWYVDIMMMKILNMKLIAVIVAVVFSGIAGYNLNDLIRYIKKQRKDWK